MPSTLNNNLLYGKVNRHGLWSSCETTPYERLRLTVIQPCATFPENRADCPTSLNERDPLQSALRVSINALNQFVKELCFWSFRRIKPSLVHRLKYRRPPALPNNSAPRRSRQTRRVWAALVRQTAQGSVGDWFYMDRNGGDVRIRHENKLIFLFLYKSTCDRTRLNLSFGTATEPDVNISKFSQSIIRVFQYVIRKSLDWYTGFLPLALFA